ncbi:hypothetical protein [Kumtagia ephedrae]|uniref:pPIWI-associating nuclease domain-containing protein n=1 Tax=Kumtagia ephedrae TaxID=2116701 RepID=UPI00105719A5|nr:hypothetical protein [Mesorhizobium ephedrae]
MGHSLAKRSSAENPKVRAVVDAVTSFDLPSSPWWTELDALSTHTTLDGLEVDPEGIILEGTKRFKGVMNIYLALQYGDSSDDGFQTTESFLGRFSGHFDQHGTPHVDAVSIDTSSFYEGEER